MHTHEAIYDDDIYLQIGLMVNDRQGLPRLGVPPFGHTECTHGTLNDGQLLTTLFPQAMTFARRYLYLRTFQDPLMLILLVALIESWCT